MLMKIWYSGRAGDVAAVSPRSVGSVVPKAGLNELFKQSKDEERKAMMEPEKYPSLYIFYKDIIQHMMDILC